jgi:predicted kinase
VLGAVSQVVLLINGPAGVGKSSIASRVALRAPNGACIAGDDLKRFVVNRAEPPTVELGLTYVGAAALTDVFLTAGYDLVVVDFIFEHPRHVQRYTKALKAPVQILALTLWAPLDVVQRRHRQRDRPGQDRDSASAPGTRSPGTSTSSAPSSMRMERSSRHSPRPLTTSSSTAEASRPARTKPRFRRIPAGWPTTGYPMRSWNRSSRAVAPLAEATDV